MVVKKDGVAEETFSINGEEYWLVSQFANLVGKSEDTVRGLVTNGNKIRSLEANHLGKQVLIKASELFEFPFSANGRPTERGPYVKYFYLKDGELSVKEEIYSK